MDISGGSESLFRGYGRSPVPGRMRPPFSFFLKKRMRRARWKRKSLLPHNRPCGPVGGNAGVFRIGADQTCQPSAGCGVHWLLSMLLRRSLQNPGSHRGVEDRKVGPPCPAHSASLCAARLGIESRLPVSRNRQGAAAKRGAEGIRKYPQLSQLPYVVEWAKALESPPGQAPVTGAASVPDEVRNAAAKPFSLDTIKKRFLFFLGKREWGFCPRGGAAKLPGFPGTTAPLARGKNPPPITSRRPAASPVPPPV